jgi:S-adenosylmethionine decarboxylase
MMVPNDAPLPRLKGHHLIADCWGCDPDYLSNRELLEDLARVAATRAGSRVIAVSSHSFESGPSHEPVGVTVFALLAESHISFHTFPELRFVAIDIFMCGDGDVKLAYDHIASELTPQDALVLCLPRGHREASVLASVNEMRYVEDLIKGNLIP